MIDAPIRMWRAATERGNCLRLRYALDSRMGGVRDRRARRLGVGFPRRRHRVRRSRRAVARSGVLLCAGAARLHLPACRDGQRRGPGGGDRGFERRRQVDHRARSREARRRADRRRRSGSEPGSQRSGRAFGAPRLRMRPDSAASLVGSYAALDSMWIHEERRPQKRYVHVDESTAVADNTTWPLDVVYLLTPDDRCATPTLTSVRPTEALPRLMAHRHMATALDAAAHRRDFQKIAQVARIGAGPRADASRGPGLRARHRGRDPVRS